MRGSGWRIVALGLGIAAVGGAVALGLWLRMLDPLSNPVMGAEDPFTHMSLVREHLRDGVLDAQTPQGALYPPGLHGFVAALWVYSGIDLYDLMRFAPAVFGAVGVLGMGLLLWRWEGPLAGFAGALAFAIMPETIARTDMMSPTAIDLMLLPFLLLALLEIVRGRLRWLVAVAPILGFFVIAHPWVLLVVGLAAGAFLLLYVAFPWRASRGPPVTRVGTAAAVALLGAGIGIALPTRWEASGTGFAELSLPIVGNNLGVLALLGVIGAAVVAAALVLLPRFVPRRLLESNGKPRGIPLQVTGAAGLATLLALIVIPAVQHGMPDFVNLPRMIGWPVLILAVMALVLIPLAGGPVAHVGAAIFLATLPFAIYNPLNSPYWPHRTAVFVGLGAAILTGVAARRLADVALAGVSRASAFRLRGPRLGTRARAPRRTAIALAAPLLVGLALSGMVLAETPEPYAGGWYRLFTTCEFNSLRDIATMANENPHLFIVTGSWESQLVISAFTEKAGRVWYKRELFSSSYPHDRFVGQQTAAERPTLFVVDRHLPSDSPRADWSWLDAPPFVKVRQTCGPAPGSLPYKVVTYLLPVTPSARTS